MKRQCTIGEWAQHSNPKISPSVNGYHRLSAALQWYIRDSEKVLVEQETVCEQERQCMVKSRVQIRHAAEGIWKGDSQGIGGDEVLLHRIKDRRHV